MNLDSRKFDIGLQILKARLRMGMSQESLARAAGVSQSAIAQIESGQIHPRYKTLCLISEALDVPMMDFFRDTVPNRILGTSLLGMLWIRFRYWWYRRQRNKNRPQAS